MLLNLERQIPYQSLRAALTYKTHKSTYVSDFYDIFIPSRSLTNPLSSLFPGICVVQKDFLSFLSTWWAELLQGVITSEWRAAGCRWANFNSPQNGKNLKWSKMSRGYTALLRSCDRDTAWSGEATATTKLTKLTAVWVMGTDIERLFLEAMGWVMP